MDTISQLKYPPLRQHQLSSSDIKQALVFLLSWNVKLLLHLSFLWTGLAFWYSGLSHKLIQAAINLRSSAHQLAASSLRQQMEGSLKWATAEVLISEDHDIGFSGPQRRYSLRLLQVLCQDPFCLNVVAGTEGNKESRELPGTRGCRSVLVQA